ncbi:hypothetical protein [Aquipseudomonas campi]
MSNPMITLGGIPIPPQAGAPEQSTDPLKFSAVVRMSNGAGVKMTHASNKASGSITGSGFTPAGLDGLDYSGPLELLLTQPRTVTQALPNFVLNAACRPDQAPWAYALVDNRWRRTPCVLAGLAVTVTPVPDATQYMVQWMPRYMVFADEPPASMSTSHSWSIPWEEV